MSATVRLKVGDTLAVLGTYKDSAGNPVNLDTAGITVTSAVLAADGEQSYPLTVAKLDQTATPGQFQITGNTSTWTPGKCLRWDVRYTNAAGVSFASETALIDLAEQIAPRP